MASRWANSRFRNARHDQGRWGPRKPLFDSSGLPGWLLDVTDGNTSQILLAADLRYGQEHYWAGGREVAATDLWGSVTTSAKVGLRGGIPAIVAANTLPIADDGLLIEETRTPLAVYSRTLDPLAWTLTNMTRSAAVGADGQAGAAIQLTATGANATAIAPAVTLASAARRFAPYIRRISGTGNIDVTFDNGSTWTTLSAPTGSYTRIAAGATVANPQIGIRIATSGDEILVDFANGETGSYDTSPIVTTSALTARAADSIYRALTAAEIAALGVAGTIATTYKMATLVADATHLALSNNTTANRTNLITDASGRLQAQIVNGGSASFSEVFGTYTAGTVGRSAIAFAANDARAAHNGTLSTADTSVTVLSTFDRMVAGAIIAGSVLGARHLETIAVWGARKTDSFIQGWGA